VPFDLAAQQRREGDAYRTIHIADDQFRLRC
jgi:hypothetical protein